MAVCKITITSPVLLNKLITSFQGLADPIMQGVFKFFEVSWGHCCKTYIQAIAILFGSDPNSTDKEIKDVMEFLKKMAEVSRTQ